jgi:hypothetical protein
MLLTWFLRLIVRLLATAVMAAHIAVAVWVASTPRLFERHFWVFDIDERWRLRLLSC